MKIQNLKDSYKKYKYHIKQSGNETRSCALYKEFDRVLSVRIVVKQPQDCDVGVAKELGTITAWISRWWWYNSWLFQENQFEETKGNQKRQTLKLRESLETEAFVDELE